MDDLGLLAAGLDRLLDAAHWRAWAPSSEVSVPDVPVDLLNLAETLLTDTGADVDYDANDLTATWLYRSDAKTEAQITWDGCCISFATTVRLVPCSASLTGYFVVQPDEDVASPQVFARVTWPASLDARVRVVEKLFAPRSNAFSVEVGAFWDGAVHVDEPRVREAVRRATSIATGRILATR
ncbi:hypothetical protein K2Z84_11195 [Candidatus Binatia bacterium]|nr:hypothetical protein [Candidatus Binatia bacterium]